MAQIGDKFVKRYSFMAYCRQKGEIPTMVTVENNGNPFRKLQWSETDPNTGYQKSTALGPSVEDYTLSQIEEERYDLCVGEYADGHTCLYKRGEGGGEGFTVQKLNFSLV